uniref:SUEL-type lectin domain-containing protein n=1 Tax=Nothobranchius rachovii TaxID=451742 RepID=A0A1A8P0N8_9TELE
MTDVHSAPDVSLYLHSILKNHTAHACEGDILIIKCPLRTSVAVLSAFYGRRVPDKYLCPSVNTNMTGERDTECTSPVAIEKVLSECQDQQSCHIPVLAPVFGPDSCPLTSKYLLVYYKCRPVFQVFNPLAAGVADLQHLKPTYLVAPHTYFMSTDYTHGGWYTGPTYKTQNVFVTNSLEIFEKMWAFPERVALYFVSGICAGLVFLLCLFGIRSTIVRDVKDLVSDLNDQIKASRRKRKELIDNLFDEEVSDTSSFCRLTQSYRTTDVLSPSALTMEMVDVQQMRDLPSGDIWPHLDSSPYAIHKIKTYNS